MTIPISNFYPAVQREAAGCPQPLIKDSVIRAIREFCRETYIYKLDLAPVTLIKNKMDYRINQPDGHRVLSIVAMRNANGNKVFSRSEDELDDSFSNWRDRTGEYATDFVQEDPTSFRIIPVPTVTVSKGLKDIRGAVMPELTAIEVDDLFEDEYDEAIKDGALKRILSMTGKAWFEPEMASMHAGLFRGAINKAKIDVARGHSNARRRPRKRKLKGAP